MLDKLIESKNNAGANRRLGGFLFSTFTAAIAVLTFALVYSLFTYNVAFGGGNLDISSIIAPVQTTENAPPAEQPPAAQKQSSAANAVSKLPARRDVIMRVDEATAKVPTTISVVRNQSAARPDSRYTLGNIDSDLAVSGSNAGEGNSGGNGATATGIAGSLKSQAELVEKTEVTPPPVVKIEPKKAEPEKKKTIVTGGVVNGKAITLVKPEYSKAAQAIRASGEVKVQVTIDEDGSVISASAVSGHPLLRPSAVNAARASKFSPTFLSNQKVKVTGIIVYNFKQQ